MRERSQVLAHCRSRRQDVRFIADALAPVGNRPMTKRMPTKNAIGSLKYPCSWRVAEVGSLVGEPTSDGAPGG